MKKPRISPPDKNNYGVRQMISSRRKANNNNKAARHESNPRFRKKNSVFFYTPVISNGPITPKEALTNYSFFLNSYERNEIMYYPDIYYLGISHRKIIPNEDESANFGFDQDDFHYNLISGDHLAYRYEIISLYGIGAFGQVVRCYDHKLKMNVAVKMIINTEQMHQQGVIEAQILSRLNEAKVRHVVSAYDYFIFRRHICISFEVLSFNLYQLIEHNNFGAFPIPKVKLISIQILSALEQCHRLGIVHCDIKPENVSLNDGSDSFVKLIDFGSSCIVGNNVYEYIQSRYYRAPEVILGIKYGPPMDIWSFSLIIIEMLIGKPLFQGESELEMLSLISQLIGPPPQELVESGSRKNEFFDENLDLLPENQQKLNISWGNITEDNDLINLLQNSLTWDQNCRITARDALKHPWVRSFKIVKSKNSSVLPYLK